MKSVLYLIISIVLLSCGHQKQAVNSPEISTIEINKKVFDDEESKILLGLANEDGLKEAPFINWYLQYYTDYQVEENTSDALRHLLRDVKIQVFMGTWCEDSQREIARFYKILEAVGYPKNLIELIAVSREKDTPEGFEVGRNITYVPTFIFYKNDKELNRIVEVPITSLEHDMITILTGQAYKHTYEE